jgi:hypothetical protein
VIEVRTIQRKPFKAEYTTWLAIQKRGPICRRWRCYANFIRDVGPKPSWRHLLIRADTSREFGVENVRWQMARPYRSLRSTSRTG